jgi:hypothetical protein
LKNLKEKAHLEDLSTDAKTRLKFQDSKIKVDLKESGCEGVSGFISLRIGNNSGLL